jgi:hypothetical protein
MAIFGGWKSKQLERLLLRYTSVADDDLTQAIQLNNLSEERNLKMLCLCETAVSHTVKRQLERRSIRICEGTDEEHGNTRAQAELFRINSLL